MVENLPKTGACGPNYVLAFSIIFIDFVIIIHLGCHKLVINFTKRLRKPLKPHNDNIQYMWLYLDCILALILTTSQYVDCTVWDDRLCDLE